MSDQMSTSEMPSFQERFLEQAFALWVTPEIERRRACGALPADFALFAAQVVFWPDGRPVAVRLNTEVRGVLIVLGAAGVVGELDKPIGPDDISQLGDVRPPPDEADAQHVTILRGRDVWCFAFDFTYNNARMAETYTSAQDFLTTADEALAGLRYRSFVDTLFSAVELMSKALLLASVRNPAHIGSHKAIQLRINERRRDQAVGGDFAPLLNRLDKLRHTARYGEGFCMEAEEAADLRHQASQVLALLDQQLPTRARQLIEERIAHPRR